MYKESITVLPPMTTFSETLNPERKASTCPHREAREKSKRKGKERKKEGKKCTSAGSCIVAPLYGDHTGSRATGWLTEIDQRGHTCMIEACFYRMNVSSRSVMHGKGKAKGQEPVFLKTHEPPVETCNSLALSKHRRLIESLPAGTQG